MDAAWPAADREESGGWVLRAASGVTQRANSVWPRDPGDDDPHRLLAALREARLWYRNRRLPLIFQILTTRARRHCTPCWTRKDSPGSPKPWCWSGTRAARSPARATRSGVEISAEPSAEWLGLWWSVDGRGGATDSPWPAASSRGAPPCMPWCGTTTAARRRRPLALPGTGRGRTNAPGWGGLYCMATRPDARRRGYAGRIVRALLRGATPSGVGGILAAGDGVECRCPGPVHARRVPRGRPVPLRQEKPKRHLTGC